MGLVLGFAGIGISFYPYIVPTSVTIWEAAAPDESLIFLLVAYFIVTLPLVQWPGSVAKVGLERFVKALVFFYFTARLTMNPSPPRPRRSVLAPRHRAPAGVVPVVILLRHQRRLRHAWTAGHAGLRSALGR